MKILLLILSTFFVVNLAATLINIPADYTTIQEGLNMAAEGDTVLVSAGTYYENILWPEMNGISLIGSGKEDCIIDGNGTSSVIRLDTDSNHIIGFTIQNGYAHGEQRLRFGGGIYMMSADIFLKDLIITDNSAIYGGGVFCFNGSDASIENVVISNNTAVEKGGGLGCAFTSCPTLNNVIITNNEAISGEGGGIFAGDESAPFISHTLVANNSAVAGGGIFFEKFDCVLLNSTIVNNYASDVGGGVYSSTTSNIVENCILWDNAPDQLHYEASISYSTVQDSWVGEGNLEMDPLFVDAENGIYQLSSNSPCIDAGNPTSPSDPDGTVADMGAYFYDQNSGADEELVPSLEISLSNYPNPFNPTTSISYQLPVGRENAQLEIYNTKGQLIKIIPSSSCHPELACTERSRSKGVQTFTVSWNGTDNNGIPQASGVYLYKLNIQQSPIKKMTLIK